MKKRSVPHSPRRIAQLAIVFFLCFAVAAPGAAQNGYQKPPKEVLDVLNSAVTPQLSLSPARDYAVLVEGTRYPPIADLAQPMLRLAGLRINPNTSGPHRGTRSVRFTLKRIADGREKEVAVPAGANLGSPSWSPDGKRFSFTITTANAIELWVAETETAAARKISGAVLNGVMGSPCDWMPDSQTLLCRLVPANRGKPPEAPAVPDGPNIQESYGRAAPVRTFQDLLQNTHDEALFDYYATSQLAFVDTRTGRTTLLGKPAIHAPGGEVSPDGQYILVSRVVKPYSYLVTVGSFPSEVEVWDRTGRVVHKVASLPLADDVPIGGVQTGPRSIGWVPSDPATLVWAEALDDGNPRKRVPHRDRILWLKAPFAGQPAELAKTEHRFAGITWGERGDLAILRDFERDRVRGRAWFFDPKDPAGTMRLVWDRSTQDRYNNPGTPMMKRLPNGQTAMAQQGEYIFLSGPGASPEGDRPFLDRFHVRELKSERLFRSGEKSYESVVALLDSNGSKFLTRYETPDDPPNYFIRTAGAESKQAFTNFPDPTPQLRRIKKELVTYKREDGVQLSMTLYLPPDYKPGERRPAVLWAYPLEFTDPDVAGQVTGSSYRFTTISGPSHLFFLLRGFVVLDGATMPVVGDPETVNNTYIEQIVSSAKAAIEKADQMGVIDPKRVGVGGHSYGAFMTANLLAHSDLFRAGIARSGAYNRTLTPFGFQSERRTIWQAPELYVRVSPFLYAHKINEPILLTHGEADNNSGTFPIQSERMYHALKGNGAAVRYVTLPHEAHGYAARESIEHTLFEMLGWFEKHVKNGTVVAGNKESERP